MAIEQTILANGFAVLSAPMPGLASAAIGVWVDVGARHETAELNGVCHLLEHMAFKGTTNRSARDIAEAIEAVGGHLNAFTSRDQTAYYARVLADDVPLAVDVLADILTRSAFAPDELERERQVILQEIGQAQDTPDDLVFDMLQEASYPDQPMGRPILGTPERVSAIDRATLAAHMSDHYRGPAMALVGAGAVDHRALVALAERHFGGLGERIAPPPQAARFQPGDWRDDTDLEQVHLALAFEGVGFDDPDYYIAQVYSTVLGGGSASRLFQEIRETRGLAYSVFAYASPASDSGTIGVYAGTSAEQAGELVPVMIGEMAKLASGAHSDEVARARAQLRASYLMGQEAPAAVVEGLGRQWHTHGRILSDQEVLERLAAVDTAAVRRFAARVMAHPPAVAALGPHTRIEAADRLAARFG